MSGNAFARALHGYFLVAAGLEVLPGMNTSKADCEVISDEGVSTLTELCGGCLDSSIGEVADAVESSAVLAKLDGLMQTLKTDLVAHSRTTKVGCNSYRR